MSSSGIGSGKDWYEMIKELTYTERTCKNCGSTDCPAYMKVRACNRWLESGYSARSRADLMITDVADELDDARKLINALTRYVELLTDEIDEISPMMHGWMCSRYEEGVALREEIERLGGSV